MKEIMEKMEALAMQYENLKEDVIDLAPEGAELVRIIEAESDSPERRINFLETTKEELLNGADYSGCKDIHDMARVWTKSVMRRCGIDFQKP